MYKKSSKNILVFCLVGMLICSFLIVSAASPVGGELDHDQLQNDTVRTGARAITKNLTFYLHKATSANYVFDYSTTSIMNTMVGNNQQHLADWGTVITSWYLQPTLAEDFHIQGDIEIAMKINMSSESNNLNGNLDLKIYDVEYIDAVGGATESLIPNTAHGESETFLTSIDIYGVKVAGIDYVVQKGHSIRVEFSVSGGAGNKYHIWFGDNLHDSHIVIGSASYVQVSDIYTEDHKGEVKTNFELDVSDKTINMIANITDPLGGYDINMVNLTLRSPTGSLILDNAGMTQIEGNNASYVSKYRSSWNYSGADIGQYNITVAVVDWNGNNYYYHLGKFTYGIYPDSGDEHFFIGGKPFTGNITVQDSTGLPLAGAVVRATIAGVTKQVNITDVSGKAGLTGYPGLYTIIVEWQDVVVKTHSDFDFKTGFPLTLICDVFYPEFKIVDNSGNPLIGASVYIGHPNGSFRISPYITDDSGLIALARAPIGNWQVIVKWRDVEVANEIEYVNQNGLIVTIICSVYSVQMTMVDSKGIGLPKAQIVISDSLSKLVLDSQISTLTGSMTSQLPKGDYIVSVYWMQSLVKEFDLGLISDYTETITCDVFYVNFVVLDTHSETVENALIVITDTETGAAFDSQTTDENGIVESRLPIGNADLNVYWKNIEVNSSMIEITGDVASALAVELNSEIFYLTLNCLDSRGVPLEEAGVEILFSSNLEFVDTAVADSSGKVVFRLPVSSYDYNVIWMGVEVFSKVDYQLEGDTTLDLICAVYYTNITPVDSQGIFLENARIDILDRGSNQVMQANTVGDDGRALFRLPSASYLVKVTWLNVNVSYSVLDFDKNNDVTINCNVYYLTIQVDDIANMPVENANVFVNYNQLTNIFDSSITNETGRILSRLPIGTYTITVTWKDVEVYSASDISLTVDKTHFCPARIYYIDVKTVDKEGGKLKDVLVSVTNLDTNPSLVEAGYSDKKGQFQFRLPYGTYTLTGRLLTTYLYEDIDQVVTQEVPLSNNSVDVKLEFKDYPPPVYSTPAFAWSMLSIILLVILFLIWFLVIRKLKKKDKVEEPVSPEPDEKPKDEPTGPPIAEPVDDETIPVDGDAEELPPVETNQALLPESNDAKKDD